MRYVNIYEFQSNFLIKALRILRVYLLDLHIILNTKSKLIINNSKATNVNSALFTLENKKNIFYY